MIVRGYCRNTVIFRKLGTPESNVTKITPNPQTQKYREQGSQVYSFSNQ